MIEATKGPIRSPVTHHGIERTGYIPTSGSVRAVVVLPPGVLGISANIPLPLRSVPNFNRGAPVLLTPNQMQGAGKNRRHLRIIPVAGKPTPAARNRASDVRFLRVSGRFARSEPTRRPVPHGDCLGPHAEGEGRSPPESATGAYLRWCPYPTSQSADTRARQLGNLHVLLSAGMSSPTLLLRCS